MTMIHTTAGERNLLFHHGTLCWKTNHVRSPLLWRSMTRLAPCVDVDVPHPLATLQRLRYRPNTLGGDSRTVFRRT